jgi:1-acyl-sn-glycerol-3-phosphate acyltransferase
VAGDGTSAGSTGSGHDAIAARRPRRGFWYAFAIAVVKPLLLMFTRRTWRGVENLPKRGGIIVAANHLSHVDPFTIAHFLYDNGRLPRFLAKSELFNVFFVKSVLKGADQIPVYRRTADAGLALRDAVTALHAGECVLVYPEGSTTKDPDYWPMVAKTGVARLALMSGAPVIPVAQWGPQQIFGQDRKLHLLPRHDVEIVAGPAVDLTAFHGRELTSQTLHEATDVIMHAIRSQLEQMRGESAPKTVFDPAASTAEVHVERRSA